MASSWAFILAMIRLISFLISSVLLCSMLSSRFLAFSLAFSRPAVLQCHYIKQPLGNARKLWPFWYLNFDLSFFGKRPRHSYQAPEPLRADPRQQCIQFSLCCRQCRRIFPCRRLLNFQKLCPQLFQLRICQRRQNRLQFIVAEDAVAPCQLLPPCCVRVTFPPVGKVSAPAFAAPAAASPAAHRPQSLQCRG